MSFWIENIREQCYNEASAMADNSTKIMKLKNVFLHMLWAYVEPIHKKNQKMILQIIDQYFSANIEKIVEKLVHKRLSNFLDINNTRYNMFSEKNTRLLMLWLILLTILGKLYMKVLSVVVYL